MIIDNFDKIKTFMNFESEDDFYFCQLMKRKKDDVLGKWKTDCNNIIVGHYYFRSLEGFDRMADTIRNICNAENARAYIHLNKRSFKKCSMKLISTVTTNIETENYMGNRGAFDSVCGKYPNDKNKKWLYDYDGDKINLRIFRNALDEILPNINPKENGTKILGILPTANGWHIILKPFDLMTFNKEIKERFGIDIKKEDFKKDSPTLLYFNKIEV